MEAYEVLLPEKGEDHWSLTLAREGLSSEKAFTTRQKVGLVLFLIVLAPLCVWDVSTIISVGFAGVNTLYLISLVFQSLLVTQSSGSGLIRVTPEELAALDPYTKKLKSVTILVPFFKEAEKEMKQLFEVLNPQRFEYPEELLHIWLLGEQDDPITPGVLAKLKRQGITIPDYMKIMWFPHSLPKTKPKVCQLALHMITTDLVVIYDAEDIPEADQIKKAIIAFDQVDEDVICLQGQLAFQADKEDENLLTTLFTGEYDQYFSLILPGLAKFKLPVPLGGTSNFFRVDLLKSIGGWDPHNVTEDTTLGIQIARRGFRTMLLDSKTWETPTSEIGKWIKQRTRWLLGRIVTWLVHMRHPVNLWRELGPKGFFAFQMVIGGVPLCLLINPIFWALGIIYWIARIAGENTIVTAIESVYTTPVLYSGNISLILGNSLFLYYVLLGTYKRAVEYDDERSYRNIKFMFFVPFYWALMSIACWRAVFQLVTNKHSVWEKTMREAKKTRWRTRHQGGAVATQVAIDS